MHCTVGGSNVKVLARALQSLARLGRDYIYVEPGDSCFCIRAINSSHSAFGVFTLPQSFFVKYWVETEADPAFNIKLLHCRLSVKSVQGIVRSLNIPRHVESCTFIVKPDEDRVKVELNCRYKVVKVQFLPVIAWETMELRIGQTPDMSNHFTATAKQFTDVLVNFYPNPNDITIIVTAQNLWLQNFIDGARDPKKERRTEMILHAGEFHDYHVDQKSEVTFNVKDWKAILSFAGAFTLPVSVNFQKAGRPVVFRAQREGLFEAKYVLSTVLPHDDAPAAEDRIPDGALTISKKLAQNHKNVELYKALERKRMTTMNKACDPKTEGLSAKRTHHENSRGKKAASESAAFCASDISSLELMNEWLPEESGRDRGQDVDKKRSFNEVEPANTDKIFTAHVVKNVLSKRTIGGEQDDNFVYDLDNNLDGSEHFSFVHKNTENELDCEPQRCRDGNPGKKLRMSPNVEELCENSQFLLSQSTSEKISTVFKCCFREPFDITQLPGYDQILAEDSDGESCR